MLLKNVHGKNGTRLNKYVKKIDNFYLYKHGGSLVSHLLGTRKVRGSNPGKGDNVSMKISIIPIYKGLTKLCLYIPSGSWIYRAKVKEDSPFIFFLI